MVIGRPLWVSHLKNLILLPGELVRKDVRLHNGDIRRAPWPCDKPQCVAMFTG